MNNLVVVDDDLFAGPLDHVENVFLSVLKSKFDHRQHAEKGWRHRFILEKELSS